jgi:hypothetical protein
MSRSDGWSAPRQFRARRGELAYARRWMASLPTGPCSRRVPGRLFSLSGHLARRDRVGDEAHWNLRISSVALHEFELGAQREGVLGCSRRRIQRARQKARNFFVSRTGGP